MPAALLGDLVMLAAHPLAFVFGLVAGNRPELAGLHTVIGDAVLVAHVDVTLRFDGAAVQPVGMPGELRVIASASYGPSPSSSSRRSFSGWW